MMSQINLYQFIGVPVSATPQEIDAAVFAKYNEVRRLVTHHDPTIVNQANSDLQAIEQARATLLDTNLRSAYDASLGLDGATGGLADPQAILQKFNPVIAAAPPSTRLADPNPQKAPAINHTDVWVCPGCQTANQKNTKFCKKCGRELGVLCPKCNTLNEMDTIFCQDCGVNIRQAREQKEQQRIEREARQQQMNVLNIQLAPMKKHADRAARFASPWWLILDWGLFGIIWVYAYIQAGKALSFPMMTGDEVLRKKAQQARKTSKTMLMLSVGLVVVYLVVLILGVLFQVLFSSFRP
jgi:hypothetical protein